MKVTKILALFAMFCLSGTANISSQIKATPQKIEFAKTQTSQIINSKSNGIEIKEEYGSESPDLNIKLRGNFNTDLSSRLAINSRLFDVEEVQGEETVYVPNPQSYYLGYGTSENDERKATIVYQVKKIDGTIETRESPIIRNNLHQYFDGLGKISDVSLTNYCNVYLEPGEVLLDSEFLLINVFKANPQGSNYVPERDAEGNLIPYYARITKDDQMYRAFGLEKFINVEIQGFSKFSGYTTIVSTIDNNLDLDFYQNLSSGTKNSYRRNKDRIENGEVTLRGKINLSNKTNFLMKMKGEEKYHAFPLVVDTLILNDPVESFVMMYQTLDDNITKLDMSKIDDVRIDNLSVSAELYDYTTKKPVPSSNYSCSFSLVDFGMNDLVNNGEIFKEGKTNLYSVNLDLIVGLTTGLFIAAYVAISVFVYFYLKNKNKDDEFKKMRDKPYWTNNLLGLLTSGSILIAGLTIGFRWSFFNVTLDLYNPFDILIIVFSVISIIFGGYFIKYFYTQIKNILDKKRNERLALTASRIGDEMLITSEEELKKEK